MKLIKTDRIETPLNAEEIEEAEETWIKKVQAENFGIGINCFKKNKNLPKDSKTRELNPFLNERGTQIMAPLPRDRIEQYPPFAVTGLDFAGPIYVKNSKENFYILLCTCAVTRALYLELVTSLTMEAFLLAFRRFISIRGLCTVIYSDNTKTFKIAGI
ncbi:integrase catalytic domain-containing protein [Trichonephila clavipes]|uniref:Integrase catalytic domain-containing protein n=1 Tax=Trichonephila clavipes TaxID=2585209 RepID=A0A8X6T761_TRICX|nr:integrase catalytic domain-containing protein [Trichonephila clavipes]